MSKRAAKKRNLPVDFSDDKNDGDIVLATAPDTADQLAGPENLLEPAQEGERGVIPVCPPKRSWRDVAAHLERTLSALTYLFNMLMTATQATTSAVAPADAPTLPTISTMANVQETTAIPRV
ncbi:unnamed protein product [Lampetra planeri]